MHVRAQKPVRVENAGTTELDHWKSLQHSLSKADQGRVQADACWYRINRHVLVHARIESRLRFKACTQSSRAGVLGCRPAHIAPGLEVWV